MKRSKLVRNICLGIENLLLHKLRSLLTVLGVIFGVGSVVAMLAVGEGASKEAMEQIKKLGSSNIIVSSIKPADEDGTTQNTRRFMSVYGLTYEDHERIDETFSWIEETAPAKIIRKEARLYDKTMELRIVGTNANWFDLVERPVLAGRVILPSDELNHAPVAVLTEFGARKLLAAEHTIGQFFRIGGEYFEIIGIVKSEGGTAGNIQIPDQEIDVYIPLNVARGYFGDTTFRARSGSMELSRVELHQIIVKVDRLERVEPTARGIEEMLQRFHKKKDYSVSVPLALLKQAQATKRTFNIVLGSIACISLLVGGIGIMNIMLASVTERTREIGIRRAIGAKRGQIISQFLIETTVLSTVGGILGIGLGILIPLLITLVAGMPTVITMWSIILPLCISVGIGIIFGLYPASRAAKVDPIIALRHE
ncbi:MAG: ABC transporter permease [bacterium]